MRRLALVLLVGACTTPEPATRTLAELGPVDLVFYIGSYMMQASIRYAPAEAPECAVLGPDFQAQVSGLEAPTFPGDLYRGETCYTPFADFYNWPRLDHAKLEIGDASRMIRCDLEDALAPRQLVRVDKETWDVKPHDRVTVRWEPAYDLAELEMFQMNFVASSEGSSSQWYVELRREGDLFSFDVPPVQTSTAKISIGAHREVENAFDCGGVPNHELIAYEATALLTLD